ncbi:TetR/AcrR family transcriptional regulator [Rhodococcus sp. 14-2470-1a]|uniref:TetR/AcrR family transcriptional regulator n=1 Tax=Rhodococcus sp. 14-2470-1a TaxID=2023150 RepID=UPI000B9A8AA4|nr:TetR/AcrR family transcriptional regulator [Rhodococcus sp. 14-2470-1a]OZF47342.1 TetR family transcriptional regulator [Rhodococcus sp. 14-2470-1a]
MNEAADARGRIEERAKNKFEAKRTELAQATLHTLAELGYARTSLREIALNSEYSHGVLHYYFSDKLDLITHAVRQYEAICVTRYDEVVEAAESDEQLLTGFRTMYFDTLESDALVHRLWYDLRNQSLFDSSFRDDVLEIEGRREEMIWRVVSRFCALRGTEPALDSGAAYILLDGIFQRALLDRFAGNERRVDVARRMILDAFEMMDSGKTVHGR